ncbi:hypothetical protein PYCC9005_002527 [Savitreella phatthalungensis]
MTSSPIPETGFPFHKLPVEVMLEVVRYLRASHWEVVDMADGSVAGKFEEEDAALECAWTLSKRWLLDHAYALDKDDPWSSNIFNYRQAPFGCLDPARQLRHKIFEEITLESGGELICPRLVAQMRLNILRREHVVLCDLTQTRALIPRLRPMPNLR